MWPNIFVSAFDLFSIFLFIYLAVVGSWIVAFISDVLKKEKSYFANI